MFIMRIRVCVSLFLKIRHGGRKLPQIWSWTECLHKLLQRKTTSSEQLCCIVWIFLWSSCVCYFFHAMTVRGLYLLHNVVLRRQETGGFLKSSFSFSHDLVSSIKCFKLSFIWLETQNSFKKSWFLKQKYPALVKIIFLKAFKVQTP